MLKTTFISCLLILLLVSCNSNSNLEGVWVESYQLYPESTIDTGKVRPDYAHFLHIKGNSIRIKNFERNVNRDVMIDTTLNFTLKNNQLLFEDNPIIWSNLKIYKDSMSVTYNNGELIHVTYLKLTEQSKKNNWNPEGKRYKTKLNKEEFYQEYTNDSLMYLYWIDEKVASKNNWQIEHVDNYSFLLLESVFDSKPLLIDSISDTKVYVTDYGLEKKTLILEEQSNSDKKPASLVGTWELVSKEEDTEKTDALFNPFSKNNLHQLQITEDSFTIFHKPYKSTNNWTYYSNENMLLLEKEEKIVEILQITEDTLVLEMNLDKHDDTNKTFLFTRKQE